MDAHTPPQLKNKCSACGTSPVNHTLARVVNSISGIVEPLGHFIFGWIPVKNGGTLMNTLDGIRYAFLSSVGMVKWSDDIEKATTGRAKLIWQEARDRGIDMQQVIIWKKPVEQYRAKIDGKWQYFESLPIPSWLPQSAYSWLDDKFILKKKLTRAGIAVPKAKVFATWSGAQKAFEVLTKPIIVKPRVGTRGRHTTTNIGTLDEMKKAYDLTRQITPYMVAEEHLFGSVYRATVVGGKIVGFFRADPPQVTGDGVQTIAQLVQEKNFQKSERVGEITINDDVISFLSRQGYTPESVPEKGRIVNLTAKTGRFYGGYTKEMLPEVHPKLVEIFNRISDVVPAPILGFDLIIPDATADPDTQRWGIIECNSLPFIDLHYFALEGTPVNVAKPVWDLWEKNPSQK